METGGVYPSVPVRGMACCSVAVVWCSVVWCGVVASQVHCTWEYLLFAIVWLPHSHLLPARPLPAGNVTSLSKAPRHERRATVWGGDGDGGTHKLEASKSSTR